MAFRGTANDRSFRFKSYTLIIGRFKIVSEFFRDNFEKKDIMNRLKFYVSPGLQGGDGTKLHPFGSLAEVKERIRHLGTDRRQNVTVLLDGGIYQLEETEVFRPEDGGGEGFEVIYRAMSGVRPVFKATVPIEGWEPIRMENLSALPPSQISPFVYQADFPLKNGRPISFGALYRNGRRLSCAKSRCFSSRENYRDFRGKPEERFLFAYDKEGEKLIRDWDNIGDIRIHTATAAAWQYAVLPLAAVDLERRELRTAIPSPYLMTQSYYWGELLGQTYLENSLSFFSRDGDWAIDTLRGKVYLYSRKGLPEGIEAPILTELFRVEGDFDEKGNLLRPVQNLTFEGMTFRQTELFLFPEDYVGKELQHAWDLYDVPNAMVRLRGVQNVRVAHCHFCEGAGAAFRADLAAESVTVEGNLIEHIGMGGILFAGYGPGKTDRNHDNVIVNNLIQEIGEIYHGSNAIFLWQSGNNLVSHNCLRNLPYSGIVVSGRIEFSPGGECCDTIRWAEIDSDVHDFAGQKPYLHGGNNRIEYNDLSKMVLRLGDGNGIYISGTADGNIVRKNIVHDTVSVGFVGAIRMDDNQYDTTVELNFIHSVGIGCGIENKQRNSVFNNFIVNLKQDDNFWFSYLASEVAPVRGAIFADNIVYAEKSGNLFYDRNLYGEPFDPYEMKLYGNVYFCEEDPDWAKSHLERYQAHGNECGSMIADPKFYAPAQGDFRLHYDSPAILAGIRQLRLETVGLLGGFRYKKGGLAEKIFVSVKGISSLAALHEGECAALRFAARNKYGVFVPVQAKEGEIVVKDEDIAAVRDGQIVALRSGKTFLTYRFLFGQKMLQGTLDIVVGTDADGLRLSREEE